MKPLDSGAFFQNCGHVIPDGADGALAIGWCPEPNVHAVKLGRATPLWNRLASVRAVYREARHRAAEMQTPAQSPTVQQIALAEIITDDELLKSSLMSRLGALQAFESWR